MDLPVNQLKKNLANKTAQIGLWLSLANSYTAEIVAQADYHWVSDRWRACTQHGTDHSCAAAGPGALSGSSGRSRADRRHGADQAVP